MEKQKCPEIRFGGFDGEWRVRSWHDTVDISTNMVDPRINEYGELFHVGPGNIESFNGQFYNNVLKVKDSNLISGKFYFKKGDIIYGKINPQLAKYVIAPFDGLASADAYVLNTKNGVIQNYLYAILQTKDFYKYTVSVSSRTGMPKINRDELNIYNYLSPSEAEQTQIGEFFQNLDQSIALHEKKLTQTQNLKKAMLEKMFPKVGSTQPEIRLKGFSEDWDSCSIFSLAQNQKLNNGVFNDQNKVGKGYKLINVLDMYIETSIDEKKLTLLDLDRKEFEQNKVKYGDVFFTRSSLVKEGIAFSNVYLGQSNDITYDGHLIKLSPNLELVDPIFLNYCLKSSKVRTQLILGGKSTTMTTIGQQEIGETIVGVPSLNEQFKIGNFFKQLDKTLVLQQQQLQTLKNLKQALLEKMIV